MPKPPPRTLSNQGRRPPSRPLPVIRSRYPQTQPLFDRAQRLWLWAFLAALFFFMLAAEHWGFRISVGVVVLIGFFVYLGLV